MKYILLVILCAGCASEPPKEVLDLSYREYFTIQKPREHTTPAFEGDTVTHHCLKQVVWDPFYNAFKMDTTCW